MCSNGSEIIRSNEIPDNGHLAQLFMLIKNGGTDPGLCNKYQRTRPGLRPQITDL